MSTGELSKGWLLHSQGRRFGPLTEDELRGYFRAGMVKSVDRLTAPGDYVMRAAREVAEQLGETPPVGPPPPDLVQSEPAPAVPPADAARVANDAEREARAARALAAMNIDFAAMAAASKPETKRSVWLVPAIAVVALIALLMFALNMLHKMKPGPQQAGSGEPTPYAVATPMEDRGSSGTSAESPEPRPVVAPGPMPVSTAAPVAADAVFQARFEKANQLLNASDFAGLVAHARPWSEAQPERNEPWEFLGIGYSKLGNFDQAAYALQQILKRDPTHATARPLLADVYLQARKWQEAASIYKELVAAEPDNARLWNNYGNALAGMGQSAQAVAALQTAVRLDPNFKQAWTNLGNTYQAAGDSARATAAFANAKR